MRIAAGTPADEDTAPLIAAPQPRMSRPVSAAAIDVPEPKLGVKRWTVLLPAAAVFAVAAAIAGFLYSRPQLETGRLTERDSIVVSDFDNKTGDPVFDDTLKQGLLVQLEQSPFLSVVSEQRIRQALGLMGNSPDARVTPGIARELCLRAAGTAVVQGSITALGSQYVLALKAMNCRTGDILGMEQRTSEDKGRVLAALGTAVSSLRSKLGESLGTVQKYDTPLEQATTQSLEALQAYSLGSKAKDVKGDEAAIPLFERAIQLDPKFAMAYALLGTSYQNLGERERGAEMIGQAYKLRDRVSERESSTSIHTTSILWLATWTGRDKCMNCGHRSTLGKTDPSEILGFCMALLVSMTRDSHKHRRRFSSTPRAGCATPTSSRTIFGSIALMTRKPSREKHWRRTWILHFSVSTCTNSRFFGAIGLVWRND